MKIYSFLHYGDRYEILVTTDGSDRAGMLGVNFQGEARAREYVTRLNAEESAKADNDTESS